MTGAELLREFESSTGRVRVFCGNCGSPIYAYLRTDNEFVRIRLGSLDTPFTEQPKAHTWVSDKAPWDQIEGKVPQFPEWAPREVLVQKGSRKPS